MNVLVLGGGGYIGWPVSLYLSKKGHKIGILDNLSRRTWDSKLGIESLTPLSSIAQRIRKWQRLTGKTIEFFNADLTDGDSLKNVVSQFQPDAILHLGQQRSAPFSMIDNAHAVFTQTNNVVGTLNVLFSIYEHAPPVPSY